MTTAHAETENENENKAGSMDLTLPMTIAELIAIRATIIQAWHDTNNAIDSVDKAFARIHDKDFVYFLETGRRGQEYGTQYAVKEMTEALDYSLFVFSLGKLNITNAMTENAKEKFLEEIKKNKTVFDEKQLTGLAQNASRLFKDSSLNTVRQVYRQLIGVSYNAPAGSRMERKKDNLQKVEQVFRVGWSDVSLKSAWSGGYTLEVNSWRYGNSSTHFHFNDLLTACRLIDGKGIPDYSNNLDSIIRSQPKGIHSVDTGYFILQAYQNGNVKVKWNEDQIHVLEKLNAIGSGRENAMPDTMRKRYKPEHFHDGAAINPFNYFKPDPKMEPSDDKDFAFFPTSPYTAARMVTLAEYPPYEDLRTLEPSAGDGAILRAIPYGTTITAIEYNHHRAEKLRGIEPNWNIIEGDFLKTDFVGRQFDRVLMNAPFNNRIEATHTVKAFGHLKPGGILVGIIPCSWFTRSDEKATVFRDFLKKYQHKEPEVVAAGDFKRTQIETRIITLKKPETEK